MDLAPQDPQRPTSQDPQRPGTLVGPFWSLTPEQQSAFLDRKRTERWQLRNPQVPAAPEIEVHPSIRDMFSRQKLERDKSLMRSLKEQAQENPDILDEAEELGIQLGEDPDVIKQNIAGARRLAQSLYVKQQIDEQKYPVLANELRDPTFQALAMDEFDKLAWYERLGVGWESANAMEELAEAANALRDRRGVFVSKAQEQEYRRLVDRMDSFAHVDGFWGMTGQTVSQLATWETAVATAGGLAATFIPPAAPVAIPWLVTAAATVPAAIHTYELEGGLAYSDYLEAGIAEDIARRNSHAVGVFNALIEMGTLGFLTNPVGRAIGNTVKRNSLFRRMLGNAMAAPTATRAWRKTALRGAAAYASEVTQENVQEIATSLGEYFGKKETEARAEIDELIANNFVSLPGGGRVTIDREDASVLVDATVYRRMTGEKLDNDEPVRLEKEKAADFLNDLRDVYVIESSLSDEAFWSDMWSLVTATSWQAFQGVAIIGAFGPTIEHFSEMKRVRAAEEQQQVYQETRDHTQTVRMRQRSSSRMVMLLRKQWRDSKMGEVHIPREEFTKALDDVGLTVEEVEEVFPGLVEQLAKPEEQQPTIVLDGAKFFGEVAETELQDRLFEHIKPSANDFTIAEAKAEKAKIDAEAKRLREGMDAADGVRDQVDVDTEQLFEKLTENALRAGVRNKQTARDAAALAVAGIRARAEHASVAKGTLVLPSQLLADMGIDADQMVIAKPEDYDTKTVFRQFAGTRSATADVESFKQAVQMAEDGADAEEIRKTTGWFVGADGQPRYEITDENAQWTSAMQGDSRVLMMREATDATTSTVTLADVLDHPELFAAYPELRKVKMEFYDGPVGDRGWASHMMIGLNKSSNINDAQRMSTLLHEVQHIIQEIEGFALGAGPGYFNGLYEEGGTRRMRAQASLAANLAATVDERLAAAEAEADLPPMSAEEKQALKDTIELPWRYLITEHELARAQTKLNDANVAGDLDVQELLEERVAELEDQLSALDARIVAANKITPRPTPKTKTPAEVRRIYQEAAAIEQLDNYQLYERTAGEAEARATQARQGLTAEERRETAVDRTFADDQLTRAQLIFRIAKPGEGPSQSGLRLDMKATPATSTRFRQLLTTTVPTGKAGETADPTDVQLPLKERAMSGSAKQQQTNVDLFSARETTQTKKGKAVTKRTYDGVVVTGDTLDEQAESIIEHMVRNLHALFDAVPPEIRLRSRLWYDGANRMAQEFASRYGVSLPQAAGMLAVMSPQADWRMNVSYVERVLDALTHFADEQLTPEMDAWVAEWVKGSEANEAFYAEMKGKTLNQLKGKRGAQALWIRAFDQFNNSKAFREIAPEGDFLSFVKTGKGADLKIGWKGLNATMNAIAVYEDTANLHLALGDQHKVRNFYHNIFDPNSDIPFVTADTHQVAANLLLPLGGSHYEVLHNLAGSGTATDGPLGLKGTYWLYHEAVKRAAEARGVLPREMQSISWEAVRGIFTPAMKRDEAFVDEIRDTWNRHESGELTHAQAVEEIFKRAQARGGDLAGPFWTKIAPGSGGAIAAGYRTYRSKRPIPGDAGDVVGGPEQRGDGADAGVDVQQEGAAEAAPTRADELAGNRGVARLFPPPGPVRAPAGTMQATRVGGAGRTAFRQQGGEVRGEFDPESMQIILGKKHDPTTLVHELAHFLFELDSKMALAGVASPQQLRDMQTVIDELGEEGEFLSLEDYLSSSLEKRRRLHEAVAYNFEVYMHEGKAPSAALKDVFRRMSKWMVRIYRKVRDTIAANYYAETMDPATGRGKQLPALTDDVRNVFDRWLAADEEIEIRIREEAIGRLLRAGQLDDLDELDKILLQEIVFDHEHEAKEKLREVLLTELKKLRTMRGRMMRKAQRDSRAERRKREAEERQRLATSDRIARLLNFMSTGELLNADGTVDRSSLQARLEGALNRLYLLMVEQRANQEELAERQTELDATVADSAAQIADKREGIAAVRKELKLLRKSAGDQTARIEESLEFIASAEKQIEGLQKARKAARDELKAMRNEIKRVDKAIEKAKKSVAVAQRGSEGVGGKRLRMFLTDDPRVPEQYRTTDPDKAEIVDVERFARQNGFGSADVMFDALRRQMVGEKKQAVEIEAGGVKYRLPGDPAGEALQDMVNDRTDDRMLAEVPHLADEAQMQFEIDAAMTNEAIIRMRAHELRLMEKKPLAERRRLQEMVRVAREVARIDLGKMTTGQLFGRNNLVRIATKQAQAAERRAAANRGDVEAMNKHQRTALYYRALAEQATKARETIEKTSGKLQKRMQFKPRSGKHEDQLARTYGGAVVETARQMLDLLGVEVGSGVRSQGPVWQDLPADSPERQMLEAADSDLREVVATDGQLMEQPIDQALESLEYVEGVLMQGKWARMFEIEGQTAELDDIIQQLREQVEAEMTPERSRKAASTVRERIKGKVRQWNYGTQRAEALLFALDGDKQGMLSQLIFVPLRNAEDQVEIHLAAVIEKLAPLLQTVRDEIGSNRELSKPITTGSDATGAPLLVDRSKQTQDADVLENGKLDVLGMLLHCGNESNLRRLLLGFGWGQLRPDGSVDTTRWWEQVRQWEEAGVITAADWEFCQGVWDIYEEELLPMTQQAHFDMLGRRMALVDKGLPVLNRRVMADGTVVSVAGGYVPAGRDSQLRSPKGERNEQDTLLGFQRSIATINKGHTKERVDEDDPDPLDINPINQILHFRQSIIFAQMGPAHKKVATLLRNDEFSKLLERMAPGIYKNVLDPLMESAATLSSTLVAARGADMLDGLDFIDKLRSNYGTAAMFANVVNSLQGVTGVLLAGMSAQVKWRYLAEGMGGGHTKSEIYALSPFMAARHKLGVSAFEMQQQVLSLVESGAFQSVKEMQRWIAKKTYWMQEIIQKPVDLIVWRGAYAQAIAEGKTDAAAVNAADGAVRRTQSDTAVTSMAKIEKGARFAKMWTQFLSWFLSLGSMRASAMRSATLKKRENDGTRAAWVLRVLMSKEAMAGFFTLYVGELIATALRGDDEEKEAVDTWLVDPLLMTTLAIPRALGPAGAFGATVAAKAIPLVVPELSRDLEFQQRMPAPAAIAIIDQIGRTTKNLLDDDADRSDVLDSLELGAKIVGIPLHVLTQRLRRGLNLFEEEKFEEPQGVSLITGRR